MNETHRSKLSAEYTQLIFYKCVRNTERETYEL